MYRETHQIHFREPRHLNKETSEECYSLWKSNENSLKWLMYVNFFQPRLSSMLTLPSKCFFIFKIYINQTDYAIHMHTFLHHYHISSTEKHWKLFQASKIGAPNLKSINTLKGDRNILSAALVEETVTHREVHSFSPATLGRSKTTTAALSFSLLWKHSWWILFSYLYLYMFENLKKCHTIDCGLFFPVPYRPETWGIVLWSFSLEKLKREQI